MIFQDPMTSLNPVLKIGDQIVEQIQEHEALPDQQARERAIELLERVGHPARARPARLLPARVLGRHAPARDDRARAVVRPARADRRRAHHGARRDDPGPDPPADPRAARRDRRRGDPRDPRPRRGGRHRRPDRGHVRRAGSSSRGRSTRSSTTRSTPTRGACSARSRAWTGRGRSGCPRSRACRRRSPTGPRAATSARAARTSSRSAPRCRRSRRAGRQPGAPRPLLAVRRSRSASCARCAPGEIGLRAKAELSRAARSPSGGRQRRRRRSIDVEHLKVFFPIKEGILIDREVARVHAVNDVTLVDRGGRDARPRGRVRLRQDHDLAHDHAPDRVHRGHDPLPRQGHHACQRASRWSRCGARCRWSSRTRSRRSTRASAWSRSSAQPLRLHGTARGEVEERGARAARAGRAQRRAPQPLPARVLGRPAPAHRRGARARARAAADRARRAGLGARRVRAGADHQPARRPAGRVRAHLPVRGARPLASCATCPTGSRSCTSAS